MAPFPGCVQDLYEATAYELDALDLVRTLLFLQTERPNDRMEMTFGDVRCRSFSEAYIDTGAESVRTALGRLRPLAFSAAFKLQDMVVEWVLRANSSSARQFSEKLKAYDDLLAGGNLMEPDAFYAWPALSKAFWELFRVLVPFRHIVVHGRGIVVYPDGAIELPQTQQTLRLSHDLQGSYIRATCLLIQQLLRSRRLTGDRALLVESGFAALAGIHGQSGFTRRSFRLQALQLTVPAHLALATSPFEVRIDFDTLRKKMEDSYPVGPSGTLLYHLRIHARDESRTLMWDFPPEAVPEGQLVLREGDPKYDRYLTIQRT